MSCRSQAGQTAAGLEGHTPTSTQHRQLSGSHIHSTAGKLFLLPHSDISWASGVLVHSQTARLSGCCYAVSAAPVTAPPVLSRSGAAASRWLYLAGRTRASFSADTASCKPPAGAHSNKQFTHVWTPSKRSSTRAATGESSTTHTTQSKAAGCMHSTKRAGRPLLGISR